MSETTVRSPVKVFFDAVKIFLKVTLALPFAVLFACAAVFSAVETFSYTAAFMDSSVFPAAFIMKNACVCLTALCFSLLLLRIVFSRRLSRLPLSTAVLLTVVFIMGGGVFSAIDSMQTDDFRWADYPGYIEQWDTKVLYQTVDCDYSGTVEFEGYFSFISGGFRPNRKIMVAEDPSLTDAYRIEVHYKGNPAEMYIYSDNGTENVSVWLTDYDYQLSPEDYVYMYENRQNLEYAEPLAIEKIVIYTAYPDRINTDNISY